MKVKFYSEAPDGTLLHNKLDKYQIKDSKGKVVDTFRNQSLALTTLDKLNRECYGEVHKLVVT